MPWNHSPAICGEPSRKPKNRRSGCGRRIRAAWRKANVRRTPNVLIYSPTLPGQATGVALLPNAIKNNGLLFEALPMTHPHVADAYRRAAKKLTTARIKFRPMGGTAMWLAGAGLPTKDVVLIVARRDWHKARAVLQELATDPLGIRFGLAGEPEGGLALVGPHGVAIEIWPAGITHASIARIRGPESPSRSLETHAGRQRSHRPAQQQAGLLPLSL